MGLTRCIAWIGENDLLDGHLRDGWTILHISSAYSPDDHFWRYTAVLFRGAYVVPLDMRPEDDVHSRYMDDDDDDEDTGLFIPDEEYLDPFESDLAGGRDDEQ